MYLDDTDKLNLMDGDDAEVMEDAVDVLASFHEFHMLYGRWPTGEEAMSFCGLSV